MTSRAPVAALLVASLCAPPPTADARDALVVVTERAWTADERRPWAEAVAIAGDRVIAVGDRQETLEALDSDARVIDLPGGFMLPGFIDSHTHFDRAGALLVGVNLLNVADAATLRQRVVEARDRLPNGAWIFGGDWGAYERWQQGTTGSAEGRPSTPFHPDRSMIDPVTPRTPALLSKWDRSVYLANNVALDRAGASCEWEGVECANGEPTGRLTPEAAARIRSIIPEKTIEQRLVEARAALERLAQHGVTSIHDITSAEQLRVFQELRRRGELTVRIYARPMLNRWDELAAIGVEHGFGDEWIRIGGLKGFVDGIMGNSSARFYEPYLTTGERGSWRDMMRPPQKMFRMLLGADGAGLWPQVHAIGDEAIDVLLEMYARVIDTNAPRQRRLRVIHAQVLRGPDTAERMADLGVIAEMQPYHAIDDMRWMEERIGERARWAYAFRTLEEAGVPLAFGSDWPGTNASWYPADPMLGIYAAVTRQATSGEPAGGWFPQERIDLKTALTAYTLTNAWAAGEESFKGALVPGMLADLVVLDRDPFSVPPEELNEIEVVLTVVGGQIVYRAESSPDLR